MWLFILVYLGDIDVLLYCHFWSEIWSCLLANVLLVFICLLGGDSHIFINSIDDMCGFLLHYILDNCLEKLKKETGFYNYQLLLMYPFHHQNEKCLDVKHWQVWIPSHIVGDIAVLDEVIHNVIITVCLEVKFTLLVHFNEPRLFLSPCNFSFLCIYISLSKNQLV